MKFYVEGGSDKLGYDLQDFANCRKNRDGPVVTGVTPVDRLVQGDNFSRLPALGNVDDRSERLNKLVRTGVI